MHLAMHCIMNHDIWSRMRDLTGQLLFPLSLISALVSTVNEEKLMSMVVSSLLRLSAVSGWRGISSSCDMLS